MLSFDADELIDAAFYRRRIEQAAALRKALALPSPETDAFRLIHGEGDFLPGLVVDIYGDTAVMQAHSPGMHFARDIIARQLVDIESLGVKNVYYKSDTTLPYKAHLDPQNDYLIGAYNHDTALENGLTFRIDWLKGQKTASSWTSATTARCLPATAKDAAYSTCSAIRADSLSTPCRVGQSMLHLSTRLPRPYL